MYEIWARVVSLQRTEANRGKNGQNLRRLASSGRHFFFCIMRRKISGIRGLIDPEFSVRYPVGFLGKRPVGPRRRYKTVLYDRRASAASARRCDGHATSRLDQMVMIDAAPAARPILDALGFSLTKLPMK